MNNIENIPSAIFDWMNSMPFEKLDAVQQKTVKEFMSVTEYNEMHEVTQLLHGVKHEPAARHNQIKEALLNRFDEKHRQASPLSISIFSSQLAWKIAAVFLAIGLPISAYFLIKSNKQLISNQINGRVDTVYLESPSASNPLKIYDTVYIAKETEAQHRKPSRQKEVSENPVDEVNVIIPHDINIQSIKNVDSAPNKRKRNTIKDDSLINHYNFVTL